VTSGCNAKDVKAVCIRRFCVRAEIVPSFTGVLKPRSKLRRQETLLPDSRTGDLTNLIQVYAYYL
jgi:hypothetical protein